MLKWNNPEGLKSLAISLVNQNSVSGTKKEVDMAKLVYDSLKEVPYFNENPNNVFLGPVGDALGRYFVCALVEGKNESKDTLILVSHMDTVDVQDFGQLKEYAFDPYEYTKRLNPDALPKDAKEDLLSGDWLFGRGIMDMKTGVAMQMSLLEEYSTKDDFDGNLLFIVVPDEESNSEGVLAGVPFMNKLIEERGLNPIAVLNCEPDFAAYPGDDNRYVYYGTAGKLLPGFYFVGREAHVGESLAGVNVDLIASEFIKRAEINTDLCDVVDGAVTLPPTCLKYKDLKDLYSVQTPVRAVAYYNLQTIKMSPKEALERFSKIANEAIQAACEKVKVQGETYKKMSGLPVKVVEFEPKVMLFSEMYELAKEAHGQVFEDHINECISQWKLDSSLDERDLSTKIVSEVHSFCPIRQPMIIMFFAPPYYPHVGLKQETEFEKYLMTLFDSLIEKADKEYGEKILKQKYFQGLCDLSYFALQDAEEVVEYLKPNMPGWGVRYKVPVEEIKKLNLPVLNYGPHGRDPHKYTERILVDYSYKTTPKLVRFLVDGIFAFEDKKELALEEA
ncbi:M20/M25/M40 family metallo-hydrolase [Lutibacter sp. B2]|nr:M20/M25/M40 family metallo-hydrolase [Lutibacter sp. B2]